MAGLTPAPFRDLVTRLYREPVTQGTLFELPRRRWYHPAPDDPDLSVACHGQRAGNPAGVAAGPHTQLAQNILLSYVAGARIIELRTVAGGRPPPLPRPSIDAATVGYNIEGPQELTADAALREYVAGAMLVQMFRHSAELSAGRWIGVSGAVVYEANVGFDLAAIRGDDVCRFLAGVRNAGTLIERLRCEIPRELTAARGLYYPARLAGSVTVATRPASEAEELERIAEFLIGEQDFDVTLRVGPGLLGRQRLEHLLYDVLGYAQLRISPAVFAGGLTLAGAVELCRRLTAFARQRGRSLGLRLCETLEVENRRSTLAPQVPFVRLSGRPLHVLALALADELRQRLGPHVPLALVGGVDHVNFPAAVACGFVPVSTCTDLLKPGGYGRLARYLRNLTRHVRRLDAVNLDEFILHRCGQAAEARRRAGEELGGGAHGDQLPATSPTAPRFVDRSLFQSAGPSLAAWAGLLNTSIAAQLASAHPRYKVYRNRRVPQRIDSRLKLFDCVTCLRCIGVCPDAALFAYPTPVVAFDYCDLLVSPDGSWRHGPQRWYGIRQETQIACFADFCNQCGNCETFCPEYGGPQHAKPAFHGSVESWARAAPRDGFVLREKPEGGWIRGRIGGRVYQLTYVRQMQQYLFDDGAVEARLSGWGHQVIGLRLLRPLSAEHRLDLGIYHTLRYLRDGVLDPRRVNQVNVVGMDRPLHASAVAPDAPRA